MRNKIGCIQHDCPQCRATKKALGSLVIGQTYLQQASLMHEKRVVVLMAAAGKYALVRRVGCYPFVCLLSSILPTDTPACPQHSERK